MKLMRLIILLTSLLPSLTFGMKPQSSLTADCNISLSKTYDFMQQSEEYLSNKDQTQYQKKETRIKNKPAITITDNQNQTLSMTWEDKIVEFILDKPLSGSEKRINTVKEKILQGFLTFNDNKFFAILICENQTIEYFKGQINTNPKLKIPFIIQFISLQNVNIDMNGIENVVINPETSTLALAYKESIILYDISKNSKICTISTPEKPSDIRFTNNKFMILFEESPTDEYHFQYMQDLDKKLYKVYNIDINKLKFERDKIIHSNVRIIPYVRKKSEEIITKNAKMVEPKQESVSSKSEPSTNLWEYYYNKFKSWVS